MNPIEGVGEFRWRKRMEESRDVKLRMDDRESRLRRRA